MLKFAAISGAIAVNLGAYGAHGLKKIIKKQQVETFQVGVQYQYLHTLALLGAGLWQHILPSDKVIRAA